MKTVTVQKKFPVKTLLLLFVVIIMGVVLIGYVVPGVGTYLLASGLGIVALATAFFSPALPQMGVAVGITLGVLGLYVYRKNYGKKKMLVATSQPMASADRLAQPLFGDDVKVSSG